MEAGAGEALMAILVVEELLFRFVEHLIGLGCFLEVRLCDLVSGISVRMIFQCKLPVGLLDLVGGC